MVVVQFGSSMVLATRSSGKIGVKVWRMESLDFPARGMMSLFIVSISFYTDSGFFAVSVD